MYYTILSFWVWVWLIWWDSTSMMRLCHMAQLTFEKGRLPFVKVSWSGDSLKGTGKKLKMGLPYDPAIPLLDIYPEKTVIWKDTCAPVFIAALFTIAKTWKHPNCPLTDEWLKKMWYIYTMEYYSTIEKNVIMPFAVTWMDLENIILSEVRQRKINIIWYRLYVESKI